MRVEWLDRPLFGIEPRRTACGIGYVAAVALLVVVSNSRRSLLRSDGHLPGLVDTLSWLVILLTVLSTFVVVFVYALLNGGPALTALIPLSPHLAVGATGGSFATGVDLTLALAAAALGTALAVYRASVGPDRSWQPERYPGYENGTVLASVLTVVAGVASYRLVAAVGPHAEPGATVAAGGTMLAAAGTGGLWARYASLTGGSASESGAE